MLGLEQNIRRKGQVNIKLLELEAKQELKVTNDKEYKIEAICIKKVYTKEAISQLLRL